MNRWFSRSIGLGWLILFSLHMVVAAQEPEAGNVQIATPEQGSSLFGLVEIRGTATHPTRFGGYVLEWSNAQNPDVWLPIQQPVTQQVTDGLLGQWDTVGANIPDGTYQIRLRMFLEDDTTQDVVVSGLRVQNSPPTQIPTPNTFLQASPTPAALAPGAAQPTSPIQQPPTTTPRASQPDATQPPPEAAGPLDAATGDSTTIINLGAIRSAILNGFFFTSGLFGVIVLYLIMRRQLGPNIQRLWWQIRSEIEDDRRGR
ncbi:MAG: hypothetical protein ACLFTK_07790 [Anaerolineales bacterium]